ncbi:peripherin-2-like [Euwallacea similis]|uniref:peripherin-2-like n=1 Tax=Euwallacea similis TaxID=1736056 RepID=UPI0034502BDF
MPKGVIIRIKITGTLAKTPKWQALSPFLHILSELMAPLKRKENGNKQLQNSPPKKRTKPQTRQNATIHTTVHARSDVTVKFCRPLIQVTFKRIKTFVMLFVVLMVITVIFSMNLLYTSIAIRSHLGAFINIISNGDGEVLPFFLALPVFLFLCVNMVIVFYVYKIFSKKKSPGSNRILFILILIALGMVAITLVIIFATLKQLYDTNKCNEDGIIKAMEKYAVNSFYKKQIDRLQIDFQCCGSKKYHDWYNISWLEKAVSTNSSTPQTGRIPFSCCAIKSRFPCIHFDINSVGVNYIYSPEFNLSILETGCFAKTMEKKQQVETAIVGNLGFYVFLECLILVLVRFLQTGHSAESKFDSCKKNYVVWLLGSYTEKSQSTGPPEPPPVPPELMN